MTFKTFKQKADAPGFKAALERADRSIAHCLETASERILPLYGASLREFSSPIPPPVLALYIAHESGGKRWVRTRYPEYGLAQLTGKKPGDDEITRFDIDPMDPRSHIWAAQKAFWHGRTLLRTRLEECDFESFDDLPSVDRLIILALIRSVGIGCTRGLIRDGSRLWTGSSYRPVLAMREYLRRSSADTSRYDGVQDTDVVRLRFCWCTMIVTRAMRLGIGPCGQTVSAPVRRPSDLLRCPSDFHARAATYCNRARRQGNAATGPWLREETPFGGRSWR